MSVLFDNSSSTFSSAHRSRGISRVDIGVVIACLALAAGFAIPRDNQMSQEARRAAVQALAQNTASSLALVHTRWESNGRPGAVDSGQGDVAMVNGYPSIATLPLLLTPAETAGFAYRQGSWQHRETSGANCGVTYSPPAAADGPPRLRIATEGC
jgi:hypothetical protein